MNLLSASDSLTPRYTHDCATCHFVGQAQDDEGVHDLYFCSQGGTYPTVIARFSSEGPAYRSGIEASYGASPLLTAAREQAEAHGLTEFDVDQALRYAKPRTAAQQRLKALLPFTVEYQALLAFERGDLQRGNGLAEHLCQHAHKRTLARRDAPQSNEEPAWGRVFAWCEVVEKTADIVRIVRELDAVQARELVRECFAPALAAQGIKYTL